MNAPRNSGIGARVFSTSGNLLADRRYEYAQAAARDGDHAAACEVLEQTLELAPGWADAWFALGEACERLCRQEAARAAFLQASAHDASDRNGAALRLARLAGGPPPPTMPGEYVRGLFDQYAPRFDRHLTGALDYRGPALIEAALRDACALLDRPFAFATALDLGCGTGLAGRALAPACRALHGVDLSPGMLTEARATGVYASLEAADMLPWLQAWPAAADLVMAADVLVYAGDLAPLFGAVARVLRAAATPGLFAFTTQAHAGDGYVLGADLRFAHSERYLRDCACAAGLQVIAFAASTTRRDAGLGVPGYVGVLTRADAAP